MGILILALTLYSLTLLKRVKQQQSLSRKKRSPEYQWVNNNDEAALAETIGLYIITPTYPRPEQLPELTRLSQTLMVRLRGCVMQMQTLRFIVECQKLTLDFLNFKHNMEIFGTFLNMDSSQF